MPEEPEYTVYRSRPRFGRKDDGGLNQLREPRPKRERSLPRFSKRRVAKWVFTAIGGWILLSVLLFMISAQIQADSTSDAAQDALSGSGYPLTSPNTILVLGSDARQPGSKEPGANVGGPSRADSIMLIRTGGGKSAKLSIPRDTVVDIPGSGPNKINAAYAIGGPSLTILTVEQYLGIDINHVVEVDFGNFPEFIDALGGINVRTNCVRSDINGGRRNGGTTLRLKAGEHHLNGKQALTLARTRKNACHPEESDLTRAKRQQDVLSAIKSRIISPSTFVRLPWVAWHAPKAVKSDMRGPSLLGVAGGFTIGGDAKPVVLPIIVSEAEKQARVRRFLRG